jgi:DNA replication protein DnaC
MENEIKKLAEHIMRSRNLYTIQRFSYDIADETAMQIAAAVGKELCTGFTIDADNQFVYTNAVRWLIGHQFNALDAATGQTIDGNPNKGLFIAGPCGSGKSMMLTILAAIAGHFRIEYEFGGEHHKLQWLDRRADELCNQFILSGADVVVEAKKADVLCLNDVGSEPAEQMYMGNRVNIIRQILEARGDKTGQFTLITSNYPMLSDQLTVQYGDRVISRLQGMCNYFVLNGKDRRL